MENFYLDSRFGVVDGFKGNFRFVITIILFLVLDQAKQFSLTPFGQDVKLLVLNVKYTCMLSEEGIYKE